MYQQIHDDSEIQCAMIHMVLHNAHIFKYIPMIPILTLCHQLYMSL